MPTMACGPWLQAPGPGSVRSAPASCVTTARPDCRLCIREPLGPVETQACPDRQTHHRGGRPATAVGLLGLPAGHAPMRRPGAWGSSPGDKPSSALLLLAAAALHSVCGRADTSARCCRQRPRALFPQKAAASLGGSRVVGKRRAAAARNPLPRGPAPWFCPWSGRLSIVLHDLFSLPVYS
jgi:hypothetical protein